MAITLATLATATAQQVFDHVAAHLLAQNTQSRIANGACAYRGEGGLKCAAGCLISDEEYSNGNFERKEGRRWTQLLDGADVPQAHYRLINDLQGVHDSYDPEAWARQLNIVARHNHLNHNVTETQP